VGPAKSSGIACYNTCGAAGGFGAPPALAGSAWRAPARVWPALMP